MQIATKYSVCSNMSVRKCIRALPLVILLTLLEYLRTKTNQVGISRTLPKLQIIWDPCSRTSHTCNPELVEGAYVLSLYDIFGSTIDDKKELEMDRSTYFDYAHASIMRLRSLTAFPIILLIDGKVLQDTNSKILLDQLRNFDVEIEEVPPWFIKSYLGSKSRKQSREKHKYTYFNLYIFHPQFSRKYSKYIFLDIDTFILRNVDEIFCMDAHFAAAARVNNMRSDFNSGVYLYSPIDGDFKVVLKEYERYIRLERELKRGIQAVLNRAFISFQRCLPAGYNCGGFQGSLHPKSVFSTKCPFRGEEELLSLRHPILHLKLSMRKYRIWLPTISCLWSTYLPEGAYQRIGWLKNQTLLC